MGNLGRGVNFRPYSVTPGKYLCEVPGTCPAVCTRPAVTDGDPKTGGFYLTGGVCRGWASKKIGRKARRCGDGDPATNPKHAAKYSQGGGVDCNLLCEGITVKKEATAAIPATCPKACRKPKVIGGDPTKGGVNLTNNVCQEWASRKYGKRPKRARICGDGNKKTNPKYAAKYKRRGGVNCSPLCGEKSHKKPAGAGKNHTKNATEKNTTTTTTTSSRKWHTETEYKRLQAKEKERAAKKPKKPQRRPLSRRRRKKNARSRRRRSSRRRRTWSERLNKKLAALRKKLAQKESKSLSVKLAEKAVVKAKSKVHEKTAKAAKAKKGTAQHFSSSTDVR